LATGQGPDQGTWQWGRGELPQKGGGGPYEGSTGGTGAGISTGTDPTGSPSLFALGFYTANGNTTDIAVLSGASDLTDSQILGDLASQFNSLYGQSGLTADYNTTTDSLTFDQSLNGTRYFSKPTRIPGSTSPCRWMQGPPSLPAFSCLAQAFSAWGASLVSGGSLEPRRQGSSGRTSSPSPAGAVMRWGCP
jgi:hypothetical protein